MGMPRKSLALAMAATLALAGWLIGCGNGETIDLTPEAVAEPSAIEPGDDVPDGPPFEFTWDEASAKAKKLDRPILAVFTQRGCGACVYLDEAVLSDRKFLAAAREKVVVAHLDVWEQANEPAMIKYEIGYTPTVVMVDKAGRVIDYYQDHLEPERMTAWMEKESSNGPAAARQ